MSTAFADREGAVISAASEWGPCSLPEGGLILLVVLHPSCGDGREPGLCPSWPWWASFADSSLCLELEAGRRGKGRAAVSRKGCREKEKKRKELFSSFPESKDGNKSTAQA